MGDEGKELYSFLLLVTALVLKTLRALIGINILNKTDRVSYPREIVQTLKISSHFVHQAANNVVAVDRAKDEVSLFGPSVKFLFEFIHLASRFLLT